MKKVLASVAVVIYFAFASGVIVNYHFCMGRYDSFHLYKKASNWCPTCGMDTKGHGCCHDEIKIVKLQDDHQTSSFSFFLKSLQPVVISFADPEMAELNTKLSVEHLNHSPPLLHGQDTYLLNCVFRI